MITMATAMRMSDELVRVGVDEMRRAKLWTRDASMQ
jgi:hypothetical protein